MSLPRGLKKLHRIAQLIPVVLAFVGVAIAAFFASFHLAQRALRSPDFAGVTVESGAGFAPSGFPPELLWALGSLILFLALAYGVWRYQGRDRRNDPITEDATRAEYEDPERYARERDSYVGRTKKP